ncbi:MAG: hypothetical protein M1835_002276 [Candelina submexicana]|nr:MAG: hypothetical protein M1835_002276 [Candelina submexicana]
MRALDIAVNEVGTVVRNEVGVDPGVDHLYAVSMIKEMHAKGGKVIFLNQHIKVSKERWVDYGLRKIGQGIPLVLWWRPGPNTQTNRSASNSVDLRAARSFRSEIPPPFSATTKSSPTQPTMNPTSVKALADLGWLDERVKEWLVNGLSWAEIQQRSIDAVRADEGSVVAAIKKTCKFSSLEERNCIITGLNEIGLLSSEPATVRGRNLLGIRCALLERQISYQSDGRDLVMLQHKFVVERKNGKTVRI